MADEVRRVAPAANCDFAFFYDGLENQALLVQRCSGCGRLRNPPGPMCPACHALQWEAFPLSGRGVIYSFTVHHHPPLPSFPVPHVVIAADMAEGVRVVGAFAGAPPDAVQIGQEVRVEFYRHEDMASFRFRPA